MIDTSTIEVCKVQKSWLDGEMLSSVISFSASKTIDGDAPEIDSGDLELAQDVDEGYVRVYLCRNTPQSYTREAVGTYLLESTSSDQIKGTCELWSVLHPAAERIPPVGYYVPKGSLIGEAAKDLLEKCIDAPVSLKGTGEELSEHVIAGESDTYLTLVWAILGDNWSISIDGMGQVTVRQNPTNASILTAGDLITNISTSWDLANVPNAITVTDDRRSVTVVNDEPESLTSTVARGRQIDVVETNSSKNDSETLEAYAYRLLAEKSKATMTAEYEREYSGDIWVGDLVRIPGTEGDWKITSQSLEYGCGIRISETVQREVSTYAKF